MKKQGKNRKKKNKIVKKRLNEIFKINYNL